MIHNIILQNSKAFFLRLLHEIVYTYLFELLGRGTISSSLPTAVKISSFQIKYSFHLHFQIVIKKWLEL